MLSRQVDRPRHRLSPRLLRVLIGAAAIGAAATGLVLRPWAPAVAPVVVTMPAPVVPLPQVVVQASPAPEPPAPPALEPALESQLLEPPVVGTRCVADIATIGVPLGEPADQPALAVDPLGAAVDPHGCTIAWWRTGELFVSWDGGQTFARFEIDGDIDAVAATTGRLAILRSRSALGVVRAGATRIAWRDIGVLATYDDTIAMELAAAGAWTLLHRGGDRLLGVTDSDGATWRYVVPPAADTVRITDDGRLWATQRVETSDSTGATRVTETRYTTDLSGAPWRKATVLRASDEPAWRYAMHPHADGTDKLVAFHHGHPAGTVTTDIDRVLDPQVAGNDRASYAAYNHRLHRLRGVHTADLGPLPSEASSRLIGVDHYGSAIVVAGAAVLRWSERGGWRILWAPPMSEFDSGCSQ